jgi:hypothetical protein
MMLTSIPLLLVVVTAPAPAAAAAQPDSEDPPRLARRAEPILAPWAVRADLTFRFPGGVGASFDASRAFGEFFSLEGMVGAGDYERVDFGMFARINPLGVGGGPTLAVGPLLLADGRLGPVAFAVGELGYSSSRELGLFGLVALGGEVALNESGRAECPGFINLTCPSHYRPGQFGVRMRLAIGVAF